VQKFFKFLKEYWFPTLMSIALCALILNINTQTRPNEALKDYKDGIQNHLVWSNTGTCFFVRPNDDVTVYLVKVPDCDKGK
jgi:hypothetical protein